MLATDRERPKIRLAGRVQPKATAQAGAHQRRDGDLDERAGNGDVADSEQVVEREMQADAEHEEDHADLGQLGGELGIGDDAGGCRPGDDAGDQVADKRRDAQAFGGRAEHERQAEAGNQCRDQWGGGQESAPG